MSEEELVAVMEKLIAEDQQSRKSLKIDLDVCFDQDVARSADLLGRMIEVTDRVLRRQAVLGRLNAYIDHVRPLKAALEELAAKASGVHASLQALQEAFPGHEFGRLMGGIQAEMGDASVTLQAFALPPRTVEALESLRFLAPARGAAPSPAPAAAAPPPPEPSSPPAPPSLEVTEVAGTPGQSPHKEQWMKSLSDEENRELFFSLMNQAINQGKTIDVMAGEYYDAQIAPTLVRT